MKKLKILLYLILLFLISIKSIPAINNQSISFCGSTTETLEDERQLKIFPSFHESMKPTFPESPIHEIPRKSNSYDPEGE